MAAKWMVSAKKADFDAIAAVCGISPVTARLIRNRDVIGAAATRKYLEGTLDNLYDPTLLPDMETAAQLLEQKVKEQKKIRIIGDYDVDGVCSSYILYASLQHLGAVVDVVLPERLTDGYGMNNRMIDEAKEQGVDTILTCDNGIAAAEPVALAKELGMTVIITDHHEVPFTEEDGEKIYHLPAADAIVDPKIINPETGRTYYPSPEICGAAVAYKLMQVMMPGEQDWITEQLLSFCALATVCDVMPLQGENRIFVKYGLKRMGQTPNLGLKALLAVNELLDTDITCYHAGFILGPCLNASGRLETARRALALFTGEEIPEENEEEEEAQAQAEDTAEGETTAEGAETEETAAAAVKKPRKKRVTKAQKELEKYTEESAAYIAAEDAQEYARYLQSAQELKQLNQSRKNMTIQGLEQAIAQTEEKNLCEHPILVVYLPDCHESLAGIIAGRLREHYSRPAFVLTDAEDGNVKGSGRSTEKYDMYAGMNSCADLFVKFGGHKMAGGLTLPKENVEAFAGRINENCTLAPEDLCEVLHLDMELPVSHMTAELTKEFELLEPCGNGNRKPMFACRSLVVYNMRAMGQKNNALKLTLRDKEGHYVDALYFGDAARTMQEVEKHRHGTKGAVMDIVYYPQLHTWRGQTSLQFVIQDFRLRG